MASPRHIRGIRQTIPSGFAIGRASPGATKGQPGLVPLPPTTQQAIISGAGGKATSGGGAVGFGSISASSTTVAAGIGITVTGGPAYTVKVTAGQIPGTTTNDDAVAGNVGEYVESSISSPVTLTTATIKNLTSISLTAGDWDVWGTVAFGFTVGATFEGAGLSLVSATFGPDFHGYSQRADAAANSLGTQMAIPIKRFSLASTTTVYLVGQGNFTAGSGFMEGGVLQARRVR